MHIVLLLALLQAPSDSLQFESIYRKPFNDTLLLSLAVAHEWRQNESQLRVSLIDRRRGAEQTIALLRDRAVESYQLLRFDDSSVVIERMGFYGPASRAKLFLDPRTKSLLKQADYEKDVGLRALSDEQVARTLGVPAEVVQQLKRAPWQPKPDSSQMPPELRSHPMPQSSYDDYARARPDRVKDGDDREGTTLEEEPGPYQVVGSRIWFAKTFYDGEGFTGVGALGYFDTSNSRYGFVRVPGLAAWSGSALLLDQETVWIGLVDHPEGEEFGGGLIRYDLKSGKSRKFPIEEVVDQIVRWNDEVYLATRNGAYRIKGDVLTQRYRVEPDLQGGFLLLPESLRAN